MNGHITENRRPTVRKDGLRKKDRDKKWKQSWVDDNNNNNNNNNDDVDINLQKGIL